MAIASSFSSQGGSLCIGALYVFILGGINTSHPSILGHGFIYSLLRAGWPRHEQNTYKTPENIIVVCIIRWYSSPLSNRVEQGRWLVHNTSMSCVPEEITGTWGICTYPCSGSTYTASLTDYSMPTNSNHPSSLSSTPPLTVISDTLHYGHIDGTVSYPNSLPSETQSTHKHELDISQPSWQRLFLHWTNTNKHHLWCPDIQRPYRLTHPAPCL